MKNKRSYKWDNLFHCQSDRLSMQETQKAQFPWPGKSLGGANSNPLQYSCLKNSMDRAAWWASVHGVANSQKQLSTHAHKVKDVNSFFVVVSLLSGVLIFCDPMECSLPGSSVHGVSQARILERVTTCFFREFFWAWDQTCFSCSGSFFTTEPPGKTLNSLA